MCQHLLEDVPYGNSGRYGHVEGMLCASLRYLETYISGINNSLIHTVDLMSGNNGILAVRVNNEILQLDTSKGLLQSAHGISL